jgi:hypothetical protein
MMEPVGVVIVSEAPVASTKRRPCFMDGSLVLSSAPKGVLSN